LTLFADILNRRAPLERSAPTSIDSKVRLLKAKRRVS
jgi:hypothetical protein